MLPSVGLNLNWGGGVDNLQFWCAFLNFKLAISKVEVFEVEHF